jgi:hypothetical protein
MEDSHMQLPSLLVQSKKKLSLPSPPSVYLKAETEMAVSPLGDNLALALAENLVPPPFPNPLAFELELQPDDRNNWCWAAVAVSISRYFNPESPWTLERLVETIFSQNDFCDSDNLDCQWCLQNALFTTCNFTEISGPPDALNPEVISRIQQEIAEGRPVACRVRYPEGAGHFVVIYGIDTTGDQPILQIRDPQTATPLNLPLDTLLNDYNWGARWTDCYFTKKENSHGD